VIFPILFSLVYLSLLSLQCLPLLPQGTRLHSFIWFRLVLPVSFFFFIRLFIEKRTALSFSPRRISVCLQLARSVFVASGSLSFSRSAEKRFQMLENENATPAADVDRRKTGGARRNRSGVAAWKLARCSTCFRCPVVSFAWDDDKPQSLAPSGFV